MFLTIRTGRGTSMARPKRTRRDDARSPAAERVCRRFSPKAGTNYEAEPLEARTYLDSTLFHPKLDSPAGSGPRAVVSADFNAAGRPDLAVANAGNTVSLLLGQGDGTFQTPIALTVGQVPAALAVADFNGDGKPDLV